MGKVQEESRWIPHELSEATKIYGVTLHSLCFQSPGKRIFCTKSLQAMKSGFFIITLNINVGFCVIITGYLEEMPSPLPGALARSNMRR